MDQSHRKVLFTQSWVLFFKNYANFSGRSSRSAFWFWALWSVIIGFSIEVLRAISLEAGIIDVIDLLWTVAILIPNLAIAARRLHDVGKSGWWQLLSFTIIGIIPLFIWVIRAGDSETNKYGDNIEEGLLLKSNA